MENKVLSFLLKFKADTDQANKKVDGLFDRIKQAQDPAYWKESDTRIFSGLNGVDVDNLSTSLLILAKNGKVSSTSLAKLVSTFGSLSGIIGTAVGALVLYKKTLDGCLEYCTDIAEGFGDVAVGGIELFVDGINNLIDMIDDAIEKIQEFSELGIESQQGYFTLYNYLGTAGEEIVAFTDKLEKVYGMDSSKLVGGMRGILGMVTNMNLEMSQMEDLSKSFIRFGQDLSAFSGYSFEDVVGQLEGAILQGSIRITSPLVRALDLKKEDVELFRELNSVEERAQFLLSRGEKVRGTYEKWLETSSGKVETYNNRVETLMNSIGRLVTGLYAQVAPLLSVLTELITHLVDGLAELFYVDLKDSEENQAEDYYNSIADSLDNVAESAKKAQNNLGKFDEVNNVNKNTSSGSGSVGNTDWSFLDDWLKDIKEKETYFTKLRDKIIRLWTEKNYKGIGQLLAKEFKSLLTDVDWNSIEGKIKNIGTIIAQLFNGFTDPELGDAVGDTLIKAINTGFGFLYSFAKEYDFGELGDSLLEAWYSFWNGLDTSDFANAVSEWFWGVVETIFNFTNGNGKDTDKLTLEDLIGNDGTVPLELVGVVASGSYNKPTEPTGDEKRTSMGSSLADIVNRFFLGIRPDENGNYTLEDVVAMGEGKGQGFTEERTQQLADSFVGVIDTFFDNIQTFLDELEFEDIKEKLIDLVKRIVQGLVDNSESWGETLNELFTTIFELARTVLEEADKAGLLDALDNFLKGLNIGEILMTWIKLQLQYIWLKFQAEFNIFISGISTFATQWANTMNVLKDKIKEKVHAIAHAFGEELGKAIIKPFQNIINTFKKISNDPIGNGLSKLKEIVIPKAATGGLVMGNTLVEVGEGNKKEAIVPLEQNTAWIKTLAKEIGGQIKMSNQSSGGGSVTIDMRGYQKNFFTRNDMIEFADMVVEALKVSGYRGQLVY